MTSEAAPVTGSSLLASSRLAGGMARGLLLALFSGDVTTGPSLFLWSLCSASGWAIPDATPVTGGKVCGGRSAGGKRGGHCSPAPWSGPGWGQRSVLSNGSPEVSLPFPGRLSSAGTPARVEKPGAPSCSPRSHRTAYPGCGCSRAAAWAEPRDWPALPGSSQGVVMD